MDFATGPLGTLLSKLGQLLQDEYNLQKGVKKDIQFVTRELESMHAALRNVGEVPLQQLQEVVKIWARDVRKLSYDMEDIVDTFLVRVQGSKPPSKRSVRRFIKKMTSIVSNTKTLGQEIKDIKERVKDVAERRDRYKVHAITCTETSVGPHMVDPRIQALYIEADRLVGIDEPREELISKLTREDGGMSSVKRRIVSIVGLGGLGKTTLAKAVYDKLKYQFSCMAFVSVSRDPDITNILKHILYELDKEYKDIYNTSFNLQHLMDHVYEFLKAKRYLIILDDIWSTRVWEILRLSFPENDRGSRIITTTRIHDVALSCCGDESSIYKMNPLSDEASQKLFFGRIFGSENQCPDYLKKAAKTILKRCGGLPLAIITISALLAGKRHTTEEWMKVHASMGAADNGTRDTNKILSLSFYDLPPHLRTCLLYLSMFPEDYAIGREQLVWKWIAEDFIATEQGSTLEQVANSYFNQLINTNMIQAVDIQYDGTVKYCRVHDMIRELIISISDELKFSTIQDHYDRKCIPQEIYRLSHQSYSAKHALQNISSESLSHVRSFTLFGPVREVPYLQEFKSMRVLDLGQCRSVDNNHIKIIVQLFLLKYLRLSYTKVTELPEEIGNLKHLLTLDLRDCKISKMPATVARLQKLQNLLVCGGVTLPDDIGNMQSLELLLSIYLSSNSIKFIEELGKLVQMRRLEITFEKPDGMANEVRAYTDSLVSSLNKLANLETLNIQNGENSPLDSMKDICPAFFRLRKLIIGFISKLPGWIRSLKNLVHLEVQLVTMKKEDLDILEGISTLIYLEIKLNCAPKERLVVGNQGLRCLEEFHLICSEDGLGLVFEAGAMPVLRKLHLGFLARKALSKDDGVFNSIGNLSGLENLRAEVDCSGSTRDHVDAIEISFYSAAAKHPNRLTPEFQKLSEALMLWEEEVEEEEGDDEEEEDQEEEEEEQFAIMTNLQEATSVAPKILSKEDDETERSF